MVLAATSAVTVADQQGAVSGTPASLIGKEVKPVGKMSVQVASRTVEQMKAFDATHPASRNAQATHLTRIPMGEAAYAAAKRQAANAPVGPKPTLAGPPPAAPNILHLNKLGPSETDSGNGFYPPDSNGSIGTTQIVAPVNLTFNVYNRLGTALLNTSFNAFLGTTNSLSDPRVIYDPIWNRWVVSIIDVPAATDPACVWIAASKTPSATGAWWIYHICTGAFGAGALWDYDIQGMTQDAVLITGNIFPLAGGYAGPAIFAAPKAKIYNGLGFSSSLFNLPASVGTLTPPIVQDSNASAYLIAADSSGTKLDIYRGTNLSNETQFSLVLQSQPAASFSVPPNARQPGTTAVLDSLDGRFTSPSAQYGNSLWAVHTTALASYPAPQFFQIDTGANTITQSGNFFESATSDDWNPAITANPSGEAFVTWNSTDVTATVGKHNARVRFSGRAPADTLGVIGAGRWVVASTVPLTGNDAGGVQRWGDYASVVLDPTPRTSCGGAGNRNAAFFNERIKDTNNWGVQFGIGGFC